MHMTAAERVRIRDRASRGKTGADVPHWLHLGNKTTCTNPRNSPCRCEDAQIDSQDEESSLWL